MQILPDIIDYNLKILFIGFNPSLTSAETKCHYAGKSNRFWKLLYLSGLTPRQYKPQEGIELLKLGFGSTNIVDRPTKRADEITKEEFSKGREILKAKLMKFRPKIACYVGIGVYKELTCKKNVILGLQSDEVAEEVKDFVCSSTSGLNSKPIEEQLDCFKKLKMLSDKLLR